MVVSHQDRVRGAHRASRSLTPTAVVNQSLGEKSAASLLTPESITPAHCRSASAKPLQTTCVLSYPSVFRPRRAFAICVRCLCGFLQHDALSPPATSKLSRVR